MSLFLSRKNNQRSALGIWHITESLDELLKMKNISEEDLSMLRSFAHEQRKKEWLVTRILTGQLSGEKDAQILYDKHNKPSLNNSNICISLSHSHDLLAVILDHAETGIDIELIKPKISNIKEKFMSKAELDSLQKDHTAEQLTIYWCAKESLYKLYGRKELAFKENLIIEPFQYARKGIIKGWIKKRDVNQSYPVQYEKLMPGKDNYMLAYVIGQD
ncbi:MAG: 4'-phosphopantetheinyl transferase superfamily protein [Bacteroidetes bacterium]|nr:MAG: 4'-phosphopantetheinyl transferase superfamily protein [Bacteroidota bacterium]